MANLYLTLVHYPVLNKEGKIVTTSVTNFDLHDLARNGKTFGVKKVFILTPLEVQQKMVSYIKTYWHDGFGAAYNPDRRDAFDIIEPISSLRETCLTIEKLDGKSPLLVATTAKKTEKSVGYSKVRDLLKQDRPILLVFGTGFGLTDEVMREMDLILDPVYGTGDYNHLPVRSAVAIILDRLQSRYE